MAQLLKFQKCILPGSITDTVLTEMVGALVNVLCHDGVLTDKGKYFYYIFFFFGCGGWHVLSTRNISICFIPGPLSWCTFYDNTVDYTTVFSTDQVYKQIPGNCFACMLESASEKLWLKQWGLTCLFAPPRLFGSLEQAITKHIKP